MIKAVLFDFDMTLVDSSYAITEGMNFIARNEGLRELSREEVMSIIGLPIEESWAMVWGRFDERWLESYRRSFKETEYSGIDLFPGTIDLLQSLKRLGILSAVASNRTNVQSAVEAMKLMSYFSFAIGLQDVENAKPAPDLVIKGMELLGVEPREVLYVGDTCADMQCASSAGVRGVVMITGNSTHEKLREAGAWVTLEDIAGVLPLVEAEQVILDH